MKKTIALINADSNKALKAVINSFKKRHIYCLNCSTHNDEPVMFTHFLKEGLRFKRLVKATSKQLGYKDFFTIPYSDITFYRNVEEILYKNLPLYINRGTDQLKELFRTLKKEDFFV